MSFLSSVTSILELIKIPGISVPREGSKPTKPDDCGKREDDHAKEKDDLSQE